MNMDRLNLAVQQHVALLLGQKDLQIASLQAELAITQSELSTARAELEQLKEPATSE